MFLRGMTETNQRPAPMGVAVVHRSGEQIGQVAMYLCYRRSYGIILAALWMLLVGCDAAKSPTTRAAPAPPARVWNRADEEYAVYNAILKYTFMDGGHGRLPDEANDNQEHPLTLLVCDRTVDVRLFGDRPDLSEEEQREIADEGDYLDAPATLKNCPKELQMDYRTINLKPTPLDGSRLVMKGMQLMLVRQESYSFPQVPGNSFAACCERYPRLQGITLLTRVGFSKDGHYAVVTHATAQGNTFSWAYVYMLRNDGDGWKVVESHRTWIT